MIRASDISINYSGGSNNNNPSLSLGGDPSSFEVTSGLQNLFGNLSATQALNGLEDYRCVYVFNNSEDSALYNSNVFLDIYLDANPQLSIGLFLANDTQAMVISGGTLNSGGLQLRYGAAPYKITNVVTYNNAFGFNTFLEDLEDALNAPNMGLTGVQVRGTNVSGVYNIEITFTNNDGNKYHPTLAVASNTLQTVTATTPTVLISKIVDGSPINTIPDVIEAGIAPLGVTFYNTSPTVQKLVGTLYASEGFPVWFRRLIPVNADASDLSGATLKIRGGSMST